MIEGYDLLTLEATKGLLLKKVTPNLLATTLALSAMAKEKTNKAKSKGRK